MTHTKALGLFAAVVVIWGVNWSVSKLLIADIPPIWTTAIRSIIATVALLLLQCLTRQFVIPRRGDLPVILAVSVCHMILFAVLMTLGLQYISVGRSVVLGYTMPLWVVPGAWLLLREPMPPARIAGLGLGLSGLLLLFNPLALDWSDTNALTGNALLLLAAMAGRGPFYTFGSMCGYPRPFNWSSGNWFWLHSF